MPNQGQNNNSFTVPPIPSVSGSDLRKQVDLNKAEVENYKLQRLRDALELQKVIQELNKYKADLLAVQQGREQDTKELNRRAQELTESKQVLLNILEDVELERQVAEDERDRTVAIIRNLADGIIIFEQEIITLFNPKAETFFYLPSSDIIGKNIWSLTSDPKIGLIFNLLKEKGLHLVREELLVREDLILEVSVAAIRSLGEELGKMIVLHDVTREKAVEQMKTEFVSITAHQLRTPLSAIKWIMNMMLEGDMGNISDSQRDFLLKTYQSNERMIRLVNDLLNITRIEEGRFLYDLLPKDIIALADKVIAPLKDVADKRGVKMIINKPSYAVPEIYIDEEKMGMVMQNLVDNAINYTRSGKSITITMDYDRQTEIFMFQVDDEGIGIPIDHHKRVFSRFFRSSNAVKADTEGTGLGLFIAKNIVESHGGKIWFKSEEDKGSTFTFTIPRRFK